MYSKQVEHQYSHLDNRHALGVVLSVLSALSSAFAYYALAVLNTAADPLVTSYFFATIFSVFPLSFTKDCNTIVIQFHFSYALRSQYLHSAKEACCSEEKSKVRGYDHQCLRFEFC
ncbi:MAG: hypothetical protein Greene041662_108 [Candidatus Peregrinibacteria bacterium Greene0416_62]|nr:MAG: hypothetical protein Greene041662_108 [Candidatus Peregrinibacteria bacterium Greene0416_62]TSC99259.1 MAG: hypothetical protein Greene101449_671 [Candidatus Peregrinibacteria bacterium Greene1014_49]